MKTYPNLYDGQTLNDVLVSLKRNRLSISVEDEEYINRSADKFRMNMYFNGMGSRGRTMDHEEFVMSCFVIYHNRYSYPAPTMKKIYRIATPYMME